MKMIALQLHKHEYSWVVTIRNTAEAVLRSQYPRLHHTDRGPTGLCQYDSLGEYCDPHTGSSVFIISICTQEFA